MSDLADNAAAVAAGYVREQQDRGASATGGRWRTRYSKPLVGEPGSAGHLMSVETVSDVNQADADAKALVALNRQRGPRYGFGSVAGLGGRGGALTFDLH